MQLQWPAVYSSPHVSLHVSPLGLHRFILPVVGTLAVRIVNEVRRFSCALHYNTVRKDENAIGMSDCVLLIVSEVDAYFKKPARSGLKHCAFLQEQTGYFYPYPNGTFPSDVDVFHPDVSKYPALTLVSGIESHVSVASTCICLEQYPPLTSICIVFLQSVGTVWF